MQMHFKHSLFVVFILTACTCYAIHSRAESSQNVPDLADIECIQRITLRYGNFPTAKMAAMENYAARKYREKLKAFRNGALGCGDKYEKTQYIEVKLSIGSNNSENKYNFKFYVRDTAGNIYFEQFTDGSTSRQQDISIPIRRAFDELMGTFADLLYRSKGIGLYDKYRNGL